MQARGGKLVVVDPRRTPLAKKADLHLQPKPGTDLCLALALHRELFRRGDADLDFLAEHATGVEELRRRAEPWTFARAAETTGIPEADIARCYEWYSTSSPSVIRCGWGVERNRNGGSAVAAILALPAVAGKFKVRAGGYTMSNSGAFRDVGRREPSPGTRIVNMNHVGRVLTDPEAISGPPVQVLFVYKREPARHVAEPGTRTAGSYARGPVHRRLRPGSDRHRPLRGPGAARDDLPRAPRPRDGLRRDGASRDEADSTAGRRGAGPTTGCSATSRTGSACCVTATRAPKASGRRRSWAGNGRGDSKTREWSCRRLAAVPSSSWMPSPTPATAKFTCARGPSTPRRARGSTPSTPRPARSGTR